MIYRDILNFLVQISLLDTTMAVKKEGTIQTQCSEICISIQFWIYVSKIIELRQQHFLLFSSSQHCLKIQLKLSTSNSEMQSMPDTTSLFWVWLLSVVIKVYWLCDKVCQRLIKSVVFSMYSGILHKFTWPVMIDISNRNVV